MALYPPIIASSLPAFVLQKNGFIPIEFSLSKYNSREEIKTVQITIKRHTSNKSVLNGGSNILTVDNYAFSKQKYNSKTGKYYIEVPQSTVNLQPTILYRVQLRFSSLDTASASRNEYTNNASQYSEWSTVCLILPIIQPYFEIQNLEKEQGAQEETIQISTNIADFIGIYNAGTGSVVVGTKTDANGNTVQITEERKGTQVLKKWRLRLLSGDYTEDQLDNIDQYTIVDSDWNLVSAYSYAENDQSNNIIFNCNLNYEFNRSETSTTSYCLYFQILTQNDYTKGKLYSFSLSQVEDKIGRPAGQLLVRVDEEQGYMHIKYTHPAGLDEEYSNFVLRRTSSSSNFQYWQDIHFFKYGGEENPDWEYKDFTTESGIIYKYGLQKVTIFGSRGRLIQTNVCMGEWEHAFLLEGYGSSLRQLKLKYDFQISSYKTNISESKTDTIGSKYPFIRRNGNMYYRSIPCTGVITAYMDDEDLFTNNSELYGTTPIDTSGARLGQTNEDIYEEFIGGYENYVTRYNYTHERKFRERVEEFLYNNKVKLYKSMQEGNMIVKMMQVNLTPKQELGRLIYTFSGTLYEVANAHQVHWHAGIKTAAATNSITRKAGAATKRGAKSAAATVTTVNPGNVGGGIYENANSEIIDTLDNYDFLDIGTYDPDLTEPTEWRVGQISSYASENQIVMSDTIAQIGQSIRKKYQIGQVVNGFKNQSIQIKKIHIEIDNPPTLIFNTLDTDKTHRNSYTGTFFEKTGLTPWLPNKDGYVVGDPVKEEERIIGTTITINGKSIIVSPPNNIYNLFDDNMILSLSDSQFTIGQKATSDKSYPFEGTVDFIYKIERVKDKSTQSYKNSTIPKPGYLDFEDVPLGINILSTIESAYLEEYEDNKNNDKVKVLSGGLRNIVIDSDPGTEIQIKVDGTNTTTLTVNQTGILTIDALINSSAITSLIVKGVPVSGGEYRKPDILIYYQISTIKERRWKQDE